MERVIMTRIGGYSIAFGLLMVLLLMLVLRNPAAREEKIVAGRVDLREATADSVPITLKGSEDAEYEVRVGVAAIDPVVWEEAATISRKGVEESEVRLVVHGVSGVDAIQIERGDKTLDILQVDGVEVLYRESLERIMRRGDGTRGEPVELRGQADPCVAVKVDLVRRFVGKVIPELLGALQQAEEGRVFAVDREFYLEVRSTVYEATREGTVECGQKPPDTIPEPPKPPIPKPPAGDDSKPEPLGVGRELVILFDFDSAEVSAEGRDQLWQMTSRLDGGVGVHIVVEGHACEIGEPRYNRKLGMRRARAVEQVLVDLGLASAVFETMSYGEELSRDGELARDRRVHVKVQGEAEEGRGHW